MKKDKVVITDTKHIPVLLNEIIEGLNLRKGSVILDATLGGGGYFEEICFRVGKNGMVIGIDQDADAIARVQKATKIICRKEFVNENFRNIDNVLGKLGIKKVDGVVFDIGFSSDQLDQSGRGFSFLKNEPLLMNMNTNSRKVIFTAKEIVNNWDEENIADILFGYGEEKFARQIAKRITEVRREKEIETTFDLVEIISQSVPAWYKAGFRKTHFATKTFQALRIAVNDEINSLSEGLEKSFSFLSIGGRMVVVSFHSIEDRVVKNFMRAKNKNSLGLIINKKPIVSAVDEIKLNSRARSAKLRIIEKIAD